MDRVRKYRWVAIPAWVMTSPAVVTVLTPPSISDCGESGMATGSHRMGPMGTSTSVSGALRHRPASTLLNLPQCRTVGRIRYSQDRSLLVRGAVNGDPLSCSAYSP